MFSYWPGDFVHLQMFSYYLFDVKLWTKKGAFLKPTTRGSDPLFLPVAVLSSEGTINACRAFKLNNKLN